MENSAPDLNVENKQAEGLLRPRFRWYSDESSQQLQKRLKICLDDQRINGYNLKASRVSGHFILRFGPGYRHFWSPVADLSFEEQENQVLIRVLLGPAPATWTFFMFMYAVALLMVMIGAVWGYSQFMLGQAYFAFWLVPAGLFLAALFFFASLAGKTRAHEQMAQLLDFLERTWKDQLIKHRQARL